MPDPHPAEEHPADGLQPTAEVVEVADPLDRLISWAIAQGDAAVEEIHAYLVKRGLREPTPFGNPGTSS